MADEVPSDWYLTHPVTETLLTAPPGCGKTEGIARWLRVVAARGELAPPRRALGLTFSNKAKANLKSRLRSELGPRWWKLATVTNFHGWAFHLYQHHCFSLGRSPLELAPQRGWQATTVRAICKEYGCDRDELQQTLRSCKVGSFDEDIVLERLEASGSQAALAYERRIREEGRVDYDDLIRLGLLVLGRDEVVGLYRERSTSSSWTRYRICRSVSTNLPPRSHPVELCGQVTRRKGSTGSPVRSRARCWTRSSSETLERSSSPTPTVLVLRCFAP